MPTVGVQDAQLIDIEESRNGPIAHCLATLNLWHNQEGSSATVQALVCKLRDLSMINVAGKTIIPGDLEQYKLWVQMLVILPGDLGQEHWLSIVPGELELSIMKVGPPSWI